MPLPRVSPGLPPDENGRRFDAAFAALDAAASAVAELRQRLDAVDDGLTRRIADTGSALARRIEAEAVARAAGDADALSLAGLAPTQPGLAPQAFAGRTVGAAAVLAPLDPAPTITTALGTAWRIDGAGVVAPRAAIPVDPDAIWIVQARYWRVVDLVDPNNDAIDLGLQWLDRDGGDAGTTLLARDATLRVQDGARLLTFRMPSLAGDRPSVVPPAPALAWRPYLRTYGADGATAVGTLGSRDATFAGVYAPDVTALTARLATIEGQLAAGLPLAAPVLPAYAVADLPRPGTAGRKAFARDGRARDAAGALEPANAGTGVEVTDNGTAWVVTGTNQQVQA